MNARAPSRVRRRRRWLAVAGIAPWLACGGVPLALGAAPMDADSPPACCGLVVSMPDEKGGAPYAIDRYTIDGGGGRSSGGSYELQGTIGQPDADPLQPSTGGAFEITGGFWPGLAPATPQPDALFANGFE